MQEKQIQQITDLLLPILEGTDMFIVNIKIKPTHNIKLFLESDSGMTVLKCTQTNKKLVPLIEEAQVFGTEPFSLEVSSPGVGEPLVNNRQYIKNIGRTITTITLEGKEIMGELMTVTEDKITILTKAQKKIPSEVIELLFSEIKQTNVEIVF